MVDVNGATPELDRVIALQPRTLPYLVYLGDKSVLLFVLFVQVLSIGLLADLIEKRSRL